MRTMPELTCLATCPLCSQRHDLTIDDLKPMVPCKWRVTPRYGRPVPIEMRCVVCGVVCTLPERGNNGSA